ncbi:uridine kinase [Jatrophihabitans sp. GAS493]|uniref:uridine kinase family protein n=1 Tax=Jatrophihabitans sp. GAS493 TaxID=1907575 RepID=UPI000BB74A63|nr:hypothetical protein [Jatrophihabitans sp. GAS493]
MKTDVDLANSLSDIAARIVHDTTQRPPRCGSVRVVAIDGGAASGKTSLADKVYSTFWATERHTELIHIDNLLDGWGDQFTFWPRLRDGVLARLANGQAGSYQRYDWKTATFTGEIRVPPTDVLIVEGVSAIECCGDRAAFRVLIDLPRSTRERRWSERDGTPLQPEWVRWLDAEDDYFRTSAPEADLLLGPTGP